MIYMQVCGCAKDQSNSIHGLLYRQNNLLACTHQIRLSPFFLPSDSMLLSFVLLSPPFAFLAYH